MGNGDHFVRRNAEVFTLQAGRGDKLGRGDISGWNAVLFKVRDIVRTARYARPSRAHRLDHTVAA